MAAAIVAGPPFGASVSRDRPAAPLGDVPHQMVTERGTRTQHAGKPPLQANGTGQGGAEPGRVRAALGEHPGQVGDRQVGVGSTPPARSAGRRPGSRCAPSRRPLFGGRRTRAARTPPSGRDAGTVIAGRGRTAPSSANRSANGRHVDLSSASAASICAATSAGPGPLPPGVPFPSGSPATQERKISGLTSGWNCTPHASAREPCGLDVTASRRGRGQWHRRAVSPTTSLFHWTATAPSGTADSSGSTRPGRCAAPR